MMRIMLKSKICSAVITDAKLYYRGSITIDSRIMSAAGLLEGERVDVLNINNGSRLQTYVITGEKNSGVICLNGPSARLGHKGDEIMILSYALYTAGELKKLKPKIVALNKENRLKK